MRVIGLILPLYPHKTVDKINDKFDHSHLSAIDPDANISNQIESLYYNDIPLMVPKATVNIYLLCMSISLVHLKI